VTSAVRISDIASCEQKLILRVPYITTSRVMPFTPINGVQYYNAVNDYRM